MAQPKCDGRDVSRGVGDDHTDGEDLERGRIQIPHQNAMIDAANASDASVETTAASTRSTMSGTGGRREGIAEGQ